MIRTIKTLAYLLSKYFMSIQKFAKKYKNPLPPVKKNYEVLPKSINREIDEKEWKFLNVHLLLIFKESSKAKLCVTI